MAYSATIAVNSNGQYNQITIPSLGHPQDIAQTLIHLNSLESVITAITQQSVNYSAVDPVTHINNLQYSDFIYILTNNQWFILNYIIAAESDPITIDGIKPNDPNWPKMLDLNRLLNDPDYIQDPTGEFS